MVAHQSQVDPERDVRALVQHPHRRRGARAGHHQAARRRDALLDRRDHTGVDRRAHAEVIGVHDQDARIGRETEQLGGEHPPSLAATSTGFLGD
jgi:hypothetical protein